jgi:hypothetical protein
MKSFLLGTCLIFILLPSVQGKETILLRKIEAVANVEQQSPPSLAAYLEAMPTHFIHTLNSTGKYAVVNIENIVDESNLNLELEASDIFKATEKKKLEMPQYGLHCSVVEFVEKQATIKNPLDGSTRLNRDIYVSVTMQMINREDPSDQKTFQVPAFKSSWDEDIFGAQVGGDLERRTRIDAFAKSSAEQMAKEFVKEFEQVIFVYGKIGSECTILAGYENGIKIGQFFDVFISQQIIHPITKKPMKGTKLTMIGKIEVINVQADVATCKILEDLGINTEVTPKDLPVARLAQ